jgi:hypothetical protein
LTTTTLKKIEEKIDSKTGKPKTYLDGTQNKGLFVHQKRLKLISKIKDRFYLKLSCQLMFTAV